ncbi:MAG: phenylalanine--tRNA ligase subunit beta [Acidobacteriota bacterium]|nr:phenylalanine--tRNA ligase subunit beta [Acidobacteriota bacterium]
MRYSRSWLERYVELPESTEALAEKVTAIGFAVEAIESSGNDTVFDLEVNPNRPDCMNHFGLARELAAAFCRPLERPDVRTQPRVEQASSRDARVEIEDPQGCSRYVAVVVRGVTVGPSPEWLTRRLEAVGVRPINNVVDVTNFVLWEYGQPLHAFDLDRLASPMVIIRRARDGEHLVTLDGEQRKLDPEVLVICDEEGPVALAGIMGGEATEVTRETTDILIESAHFAPRVVRRGARFLGMHTDASHRFERGSDPEVCLEAAMRAAELLAELGGGVLPDTVVDCSKLPQWSARGRLELRRLEEFAGIGVPRQLIETTFPALGFSLESKGADGWMVGVPSWRRFDLEVDASGEVFPAHLYEEALRFFGYDKVPSTLPAVGGPDDGSSQSHNHRERLRAHFASAGLAETITYGFQAAAQTARFPGLGEDAAPLRLANALSEQYAVMRRSLLPNLIEGARFNQNRGREAVRLFELGHVFPGGASAELEVVGIVLGGTAGTPWDRSMELDFFDLKGILEGLAASFGVELTFGSAEIGGFVAGTASSMTAGGAASCGYLGQVEDPDLAYPVVAAEFDATVFSSDEARRVRPPSRFPSVSVDLTITHPLSVEWAQIVEAITECRQQDLHAFGLKDRYRGSGVPAGHVNTTIYFLYNAGDRSLTGEEVNDRHERLAKVLRERFGGGT